MIMNLYKLFIFLSNLFIKLILIAYKHFLKKTTGSLLGTAMAATFLVLQVYFVKFMRP